MDKILEFLIHVHDEREFWKIKHTLSDIVLLIFFACLSGAEYWDEIEEFGKAYESSLRTVLSLENGIPSHDTLQRVFATLDSQVLVEVTQMWSTLLEEAELSAKQFTLFSKRLVVSEAWRSRPHQGSVQSFKRKLKQLTTRRWSIDLDSRIEKLNCVIRGWINYFSLTNMRKSMVTIDESKIKSFTTLLLEKAVELFLSYTLRPAKRLIGSE